MASPSRMTRALRAAIITHEIARRYAEGEPVEVLAATLKVTKKRFGAIRRAEGWLRSRRKTARTRPRTDVPHNAAASETAVAHPPPAPAAPAKAADIGALVERQLCAIDSILEDLRGAPAGEPERHARTIASVSRTLKELMRLRAQSADTADDDDMPEDIDEFRLALAKRIEAFVASRTDNSLGAAGGDPDA
jgi:hypothetical protein